MIPRMILCDVEITNRCLNGSLVRPYVPDSIQPASIDLKLGDEFVEFDQCSAPLDVARRHEDRLEHDRSHRFVATVVMLNPGDFMLGVTAERVHMPDDLVARVEGKSSLGRLGLAVHVTAGFIDPGFKGPITLEFANLGKRPLVLTAGMPICQASFHLLNEPSARPYNGRYQNAEGVEASKYGPTI